MCENGGITTVASWYNNKNKQHIRKCGGQMYIQKRKLQRVETVYDIATIALKWQVIQDYAFIHCKTVSYVCDLDLNKPPQKRKGQHLISNGTPLPLWRSCQLKAVIKRKNFKLSSPKMPSWKLYNSN